MFIFDRVFADAPSCKTDRVMVIGASRGESMDVPCEVDADPPAKGFRWKFNNSGETIDIGPERYISNGTASVLRYTPVADLDYGTLSCWATNGVGQQYVPCLFQMVAAGKHSDLIICLEISYLYYIRLCLLRLIANRFVILCSDFERCI